MPLHYPNARHLRHCAQALFVSVLALAGCSGRPVPTEEGGPEHYVVSIPPLKAILAPLVGDASIHVLLPPGASPHTYELRPSDAARAAEASVLFYVDESLDGWAAELQTRERIAVLPLLPESLHRPYGLACELDGEHDHDHDHDHDHAHGETDPHFWTDPLTVAGVVEPLVARLSALRPERAEAYKENGERFLEELKELDVSLITELAPARGGEVAVFHHAFDYLLHRYGIKVAAAIEPSPGQTAGPRTLHELGKDLKERGVRAIFIEPQLSPQSAQAVAEQAGLKLVVVDPLGGVEGRDTYGAFVLWNARAIRSSFE